MWPSLSLSNLLSQILRGSDGLLLVLRKDFIWGFVAKAYLGNGVRETVVSLELLPPILKVVHPHLLVILGLV